MIRQNLVNRLAKLEAQRASRPPRRQVTPAQIRHRILYLFATAECLCQMPAIELGHLDWPPPYCVPELDALSDHDLVIRFLDAFKVDPILMTIGYTEDQAAERRLRDDLHRLYHAAPELLWRVNRHELSVADALKEAGL
jgi:hypothetical protein